MKAVRLSPKRMRDHEGEFMAERLRLPNGATVLFGRATSTADATKIVDDLNSGAADIQITKIKD